MTSILKTSTQKTFDNAADAFKVADRAKNRAGKNVLRVFDNVTKKFVFLVASTPWAYRLQQNGRGVIVLRADNKKGYVLSNARKAA